MTNNDIINNRGNFLTDGITRSLFIPNWIWRNGDGTFTNNGIVYDLWDPATDGYLIPDNDRIYYVDNVVTMTQHLQIDGELSVWPGGELHTSNYTISNDNILTISGGLLDIDLGGELDVGVDASLTNSFGELLSEGLLTNSGSFDNRASFTSHGLLINDDYFLSQGTFKTTGTFDNNQTFTNEGTLRNDGRINNLNIFWNQDTINNYGFICNKGAFINEGVLNNLGLGQFSDCPGGATYVLWPYTETYIIPDGSSYILED